MVPTLPAVPLVETAAILRSGAQDLLSYIEEVCERVNALDAEIQALLPEADRRSRLLREATELQGCYPDPPHRPPLYGVLLGVKDIYVVDGFPTHAGSQLPPELFAGPEASSVTRLRAAGALILGKTVTTEFAYFEPGPTRNPHNLQHTPGGSSSGSAAAVAQGYCPLALGTQTIGSTIRPAAFCGIVGFKPTYARVSYDGVIPCARAVDTVGLFTQDVAGAALAASVLFPDWQPITAQSQPVLGVPDGPYLEHGSQEALAAFTRHCAQLQEAGYEVRHVPAMNDIEDIIERHRLIIAAETAQVHREWYASYAALYRPRTVALIEEGLVVPEETVEAARAGRAALRNELHALMRQHGIDLWISPAAYGPAPESLANTGDPIMNFPWTHAGLPTIALPAGRAANGLPLALQVAAPFMTDERLLAWATQIAPILA